MVDVGEASAQAASVGKASPGERLAMAGVLARAFHDDPAFSWVLRADPRRMKILEQGFELFLRRIWLEQEETYTTAGTVAVAVWERPGEWKVPLGRQLRMLPAMVKVFSRHLPRVLRALTVLERKHPREPHYYLAFIGVEPEWQGRGLGAAVLAPVLKRCDDERMPAFLEASTPRNRGLYERHGFSVTEEFRLGHGAPPQWRMWRVPAA
ncbi:MAG TPA: GNAT family N-acetyltransferase [Solirubrobacteraceae bacterium]|jgi:GNAT superfamily N-acetyltransferase|nr:GNAT family N-acetyltransferase [Solirubrobacteraceae bacterium]